MARYSKSNDGYYKTNVDLGRDENGKRMRKQVIGKTVRELDEKVDLIKRQLNLGIVTKESQMKFYDYSISWFKTYKRIKSINTKAMYQNVIEKHIKNSIGDIQLNKLTKSDIQELINQNYDKYETCKKIVLTVKQILNSAIDDNLIIKNVANKLVLPPRPASCTRTLTKLEKQAIKGQNPRLMESAFINILFYSGLRREEALALTKKDVDLFNKTITVNKALVFEKGKPILTVTKNATSNRIVQIPDEAIDNLKIYINSANTIYLFTKKDGTLMSHSAYVKFWNRILKNLNNAIMTEKQKESISKLPATIQLKNMPIDSLTAHVFRHNYATMLYYSNISIKQAAVILGHSDTKMIMQVYAHLDEERENVTEKINTNIKIAL